MDWTATLGEIFQICIIPLLGALTAFIIVLVKNKTKQIQNATDNEFLKSCMEILEKTVVNALIATNQTYVDALKSENAFDAEAQKVAFQKTYDAVIASLTEDTKKGLMTMTNDLTTYITEMIEAQVKIQKKEG